MKLLTRLDRQKFIPHLCCINDSAIEAEFKEDATALFEAFTGPKLQLNFRSFKRLATLYTILSLASYIRRCKIDIVVTYFIDPTILALLSQKLSLRKSVSIVNFRDLGLLRADQHKLVMKAIYRSIPCFVANSKAVRNDYCRNDQIPKDKVRVIYNGVDIERFVERPRGVADLKQIGIIANLNRRVKRVDLFLKAASVICRERSDILFVVIGEGMLKAALLELTNQLEIANQVQFIGRTYNIADLVPQLHVGVNTSDSEGFPNALLEYLACGVPAVASNIGGNREIIHDNINGFLFPVGNYVDLANKLSLLIENTALYSRIRKNCRKSVVGRYDIETMIRKYEKCFLEITAQHSNDTPFEGIVDSRDVP